MGGSRWRLVILVTLVTLLILVIVLCVPVRHEIVFIQVTLPILHNLVLVLMVGMPVLALGAGSSIGQLVMDVVGGHVLVNKMTIEGLVRGVIVGEVPLLMTGRFNIAG